MLREGLSYGSAPLLLIVKFADPEPAQLEEQGLGAGSGSGH